MGRRLSEIGGEEDTVWRDGRLERNKSWSRPRSSHGSKRRGEEEKGEMAGDGSRR